VAGIINGFQGASRNNSSTVDYYFNNSGGSSASISSAQTSSNTFVFSTPAPASYSNARISFYSIGTSINLSLLNNRTTTLMNTLSSVLP
jgi:hypothetical protein